MIDLEKGRFNSLVLAIANDIFLDTKNNNNKKKSFFPETFKESLLQEQKGVLLNAMNLYDVRNKIIKLFEDTYITPSTYAYNAKSEPKEYDTAQKFEPKKSDEVEKSEEKFDKNIEETLKLMRKKSDELNKMITEKDEIINKDLFKKYFYHFENLSDMQKKCLQHRMHKKIKN